MTRSPLKLGAVGLGIVIVTLTAALAIPHIAFVSRTDDYTAEFVNAAGLTSDSQVYVAGVPAGRVTDVRLAGDHVDVAFRLDKAQPLGTETTAAIKLQTVLGRRYLAVNPVGAQALQPGSTINRDHTNVPYDIGTLERTATDKADALDTDRLRKMISTVSGSMPKDPKLVGGALDGVAAVSRLLANRNGQFQRLLTSAKSASDLLVGQQKSITKLLDNGTVVAQFLVDKRTAIHSLLTSVQALARSVNTLLADNHAQLGPLLRRLAAVSKLLRANEKSLTDLLTTAAPTVRYIANAAGNGSWVDLSGPGFVLPDNVLCVSGLARGCK
jgi:phospholipid/cholesterol/gamma-HCH transport system substrate-binding protein